MKNNFFIKCYVLIIIILFIETCIFPSLTSESNRFEIENKENINKNNNYLYYAIQSGIIYVDDNASPDWYNDTQVRTIQEGIDQAVLFNYDNVFVYNGIYDNGGYANLIDNINYIIITGENNNKTIIDGMGIGLGFFIQDSENITISNFTIKNTGSLGDNMGVRLVRSNYCNLLECKIQYSNSWGIAVESSNYNIIASCKINNCKLDGVFIGLDSNNNELINCFINDTRRVTIAQNSKNNKIIGNIISSNSGFGMAIAVDSNHNFIYNNDFINNFIEIKSGKYYINAIDICGGNFWYNTIDDVGNYWSDYIGLNFPKLFDRDNDGIGNLPKYIPLYGLDNFPLMKPINENKDITFFRFENINIYNKNINIENLFDSIIYSSIIENNNIYYVDDDSICPGNGTIDWPYCNIQYAIDNASAGDSIFVFNGTYKENVKINKQLSVIGNNSLTTTIDGNGGITVDLAADKINLIGFKITNGIRGINIKGNDCYIYNNIISFNEGYGIWINSNFNENYIYKNFINNNSLRGIWLVNSNDNIIEDNEINSNGWSGIVMENCYNNTITNSIINNNLYAGIILAGSLKNYIIKNIISYNGVEENPSSTGIGINQESCNNHIIKNNISLNYNYGLRITTQSNDNLIYGNFFEYNGRPLSRNNAYDECNNMWNQPYWSPPYYGIEWTRESDYCGNYWSDHNYALDDPPIWNIKDENCGPTQDIPYWSDKISDREYGIPPIIKTFNKNEKQDYVYFKNYDFLPIYGESPPIENCSLIKPKVGCLYINGKEVWCDPRWEAKGKCWCIGGIPIMARATTRDGFVDGIKIYFDNYQDGKEEATVIRTYDNQDVFETLYDKFYNGNRPFREGIMIGKHTLYVIAFSGHESGFIPPVEGLNKIDLFVLNFPKLSNTILR